MKKLIYSSADPASGESCVTIEHKGKEYTGKAHLHPDDKFSNITGCQYAEMRAIVKALKNDLKEARKDYNNCKNFVTSVTQCKIFNNEEKTAKAIFKQLNKKEKVVISLQNAINYYEASIKNMIESQTKLNNKLNNKDS